MEIFKLIVDLVSLGANLLTIVASSIAIYVFLKRRREISNAFNMLLNWSFQTTLSDLRGKLDRLNEYNANETADVPEIRNILHEIAGQVRGNEKIQKTAPQLALRLEALASQKRLMEPARRSMVAEVREVIRNIQVNSMDQGAGADNE